jgi:hypothetical protein
MDAEALLLAAAVGAALLAVTAAVWMIAGRRADPS